MTQLLIFYVLLIILSAVVINGFWAITRGRWEKNPDGSRYWTGKIFKGYHKWLQDHTVKLVPFENDEFLKQFFPFKSFINDNDILSMDKDFVVVKRMAPIKSAMLLAFAATKNVHLAITEIGEKAEKNQLITIFKEVKFYKYPEWMRDPLGECITCMSSFWGTLLWILWVGLAYHINSVHPTVATQVFVDLAIGFKFILWVVFCITLSYVNELVLNLKEYYKK